MAREYGIQPWDMERLRRGEYERIVAELNEMAGVVVV